MKITKQIIEDLALVGAIVVASGYFLVCLIGLVYLIPELSFEIHHLGMLLFLLLGIAGYTGFFSLLLNKLERKQVQTLILLSIGVAVCILALILPGLSVIGFLSVNSFRELLDVLIMIWPILVAVYFIIKISKNLRYKTD